MTIGQVIEVANPIDPVIIIGSVAELFDLGATRVALDMRSQDFSDLQVEELLLGLEANFALSRKEIAIFIAPPADHTNLKERRDHIAKLLVSNTFITEVGISGAKESVESLVRFLKENLFATTPIYVLEEA